MPDVAPWLRCRPGLRMHVACARFQVGRPHMTSDQRRGRPVRDLRYAFILVTTADGQRAVLLHRAFRSEYRCGLRRLFNRAM